MLKTTEPPDKPAPGRNDGSRPASSRNDGSKPASGRNDGEGEVDGFGVGGSGGKLPHCWITTGSSEVSIPKALGFDDNEVVGGGGDSSLNRKIV